MGRPESAHVSACGYRQKMSRTLHGEHAKKQPILHDRYVASPES